MFIAFDSGIGPPEIIGMAPPRLSRNAYWIKRVMWLARSVRLFHYGPSIAADALSLDAKAYPSVSSKITCSAQT